MNTNLKSGLSIDHWDGDYPVRIKRPLVALLMSPNFQRSIMNGEKTITIREGWRDYTVGEKVVLCQADAETGWAVMGKLTQVSHHLLKDVSENDFQDDGMFNLNDAIETLKQYYEGINEDSFVTVIRWKLL